MAAQFIRVVGDPVLNTRATDVEDIDGQLAKVCDEMLVTMYEAPGSGLAAPQVGIQKRFYVYDYGDGPGVMINPRIVESDGEWVFEEGCLSVPGLSWDIVRPKTVHVVGYDLDGRELSFEADEFLARLIQHEIDHLDGKLLLEYLTDDQRKEAMRIMRDRRLAQAARAGTKPAEPTAGGLSLP